MATKTSPVKNVIKGKPVGKRKPKQFVLKQSNSSKDAGRKTPRPEADLKRQLKIQKALYEIADAASAARDMQSFYKKLHKIVGKLMYAENFFIALYDKQSDLISWPYHADLQDTADADWSPQPLTGFKGGTAHIIRTGKPFWMARDYERMLKSGEIELVGTKSVDSIGIPLKEGKRVLGAMAVQSYSTHYTYTEQDVKVLSFVAQHISTALTRVRAIEETHQRNAELQIINAIQQGLASKLDIKGIFELVGDKLYEIFKPDILGIAMYEAATNLTSYPYGIVRGQRVYDLPPQEAGGFSGEAIRRCRSVVINEDTKRRAEEIGSNLLAGTEWPLSAVYLPIIAGRNVLGVISLQSYEREHAFPESDVRLLETLANSMSVALENARLFDETQRLLKETEQRAAELAIINSVQRGLSSKLDMQAIYDLVGDKIRDIFQVEVVYIAVRNPKDINQIDFPYYVDRGNNLRAAPLTLGEGLTSKVIMERQPLLIGTLEEQLALGAVMEADERANTYLGIPIIVGDFAAGVVSVQSYKQNAFNDSDIRLLSTLASSMGVALENARLFDETQRLLKETEERNAELAIINSVQEGLASKLDYQSIIELVGEKICEIFDAQGINIAKYDAETDLFSSIYTVERGIRRSFEPMKPGPIFRHVITTRDSLRFNTVAELDAFGAVTLPGTDVTKSGMYVPLMPGKELLGVIALENLDHENAFSESDLRLLSTLTNSMSVALENARLFDEVQKKNIEITESLEQQTATSNVLRAIAGSPTEIRPVLDAVAENAARLCEANDVQIYQVDGGSLRQITHYGPLPALEDGEALPLVPGLVTGRAVLERRTIYIEDAQDLSESEYPDSVKLQKRLSHRTTIATPLLKEGSAIGAIVVRRNEVRPFTEKQVSLLSTFADQAAIAIENVRLFTETQRLLKETEERNAELAIINSVQAGLASKLDLQAIYDLVGDKISEVTGSEVVVINTWDVEKEIIRFDYIREKGERLPVIERPFTRLNKAVQSELETGKTVLWNSGVEERLKQFGHSLPAGEMPRSVVTVPLRKGQKFNASISLQNISRENAFSASDVRLIETLASSMSVALENARLFDETQRLLKETEERNAELAVINSVQQALAAQLDMQGIYDAVGDKIRDIFDAQGVIIGTLDHGTRLVIFNYFYEKGERYFPAPVPFTGLIEHLISTAEKVVINENLVERAGEFGMTVVAGDASKSGVWIPVKSGNQVRGILALQNMDRENAFSATAVRLLETLANSMSVALENARLFDETQRLLKETEQRAQELSAISTVSQALVAETELDSMIQLIGSQMREIFEADIVYVALLDRQTNLIQFPYAFGEEFTTLELGEGLTSKIIETGEPLLLNKDIRERRAELGTALVGKESLSYLGVPVKAGRETIGVLSVQSTTQEGMFNDDDLRLLTTIAANAGAAIQTARLHAETERRAREMATLAEIGSDIAASRELQPVLERIAAHAQSILRVRDIAITLRESESNNFRTSVALGKYREELKRVVLTLNQGIMGHILASGVPEYVNNPAHDPRVYHIPGTPLEEDEQEYLMGAPLSSRGQIIGGIMTWREYPDSPFTQADLDFLVSVARQTAIAIESARLYLETQRRAREMSALVDVGRDISASLEGETVLESIASHAKDLLNGNLSALFLPEQDGQIFRAIAAVGEEAEQLRNDTIRLGEGLLGDIARTKVGEIINDTNLDPRTILITGTQENPDEHLIAVPLLANEELKGLMAVWRIGRGKEFIESELEFLNSLSRQAVIAIQNSQLFTEVKETLEQQTATSEILSIIAENPTDIQPVLDAVAEQAARVCNSYDAVITRIYGENYRIVAHWGPVPVQTENSLSEIPLNRDSVTGRAMVDKKTIHIPDLLAEPPDEYPLSRKYYRTSEQRTMLVTPLMRENEVIGSIMIRRREVNPFTEKQIALLKLFADQAAIAIENVRLFNETKRLLSETEQRAAELAIINSVQEGLASRLELQAIYDLVGDKIGDIFKAQVVGIYNFDRQTETIHYPYYRENDKRFEREPSAFTLTAKHLIDKGQVLLINENLEERMKELGLAITSLGDATNPKSVVYVPLLSGGTVIGAIGLKSVAHENAFSESDVRLLTTLANSMSIALENARLFDEVTRRKEYFEALFQNNPVAVVTIDNNAIVTSWNPAAEKLFGYTREEAVGQNVDNLVAKPEEIHVEAVSYSRRGLDVSSDAFQAIVKRSRKDGSIVDVELSAVPIIVQGEKQGIYALYHDITELQRARQEAIAANEAKSSFLATMSHEIRTPMNAVIGMSGLLMDTELSKEQRDYAETIRNSGDALLAIINDILDFSKIEAGKMDVEYQPFDLRECVESALDLTAPRAIEKGLDIAYIIDDDVPAGIKSDVTRLRQILINLLSNAIKFTDKGEVVLTVKKGKVEKEFLFAVRDTGIGISEQHMSHLFQSFSQADSSTTRKFGGTGLGLAISKRLAEMMGGEMHAESKGIGKGSTFLFTIKAEPAQVSERKTARDIKSIQSVLQDKRVLIVDDNATNRRILMLQTEKWGMRPRETEHPAEALEWIQNGEPFDLAILDLQMPEMDGVMLTRAIRKVSDEKSLPIILLTSLGRREIGAEDLEFAAYLTKPLKPSALYDALAVLFARNVVSPKTDAARPVLDAEIGKQHPLRILLAEDNAVNQKLALRILEQMGYRADIASNGLEAVESIERQVYDVILMDVQMPDMDGLDATRNIRRLTNATQPHIIAMTANAMEGDREMCLAAGMDDYISKPIRVHELVGALMRAERKS